MREPPHDRDIVRDELIAEAEARLRSRSMRTTRSALDRTSSALTASSQTSNFGLRSGPRNSHPLALAAVELVGVTVCAHADQPDLIHGFAHPRGDLVPCSPGSKAASGSAMIRPIACAGRARQRVLEYELHVRREGRTCCSGICASSRRAGGGPGVGFTSRGGPGQRRFAEPDSPTTPASRPDHVQGYAVERAQRRRPLNRPAAEAVCT